MSNQKCNKPNCNCSCHHEPLDNAGEKMKGHDSQRRDFLKYVGMGAIGLGLGPALAYWLQDQDKIKEIIKNMPNHIVTPCRITANARSMSFSTGGLPTPNMGRSCHSPK